MIEKHATRLMETPDGERVEIDRGISHLIKGLWTKNIRTRFCCEGENAPGLAGRAYIAFEDAEGFERVKSLRVSVPGIHWEEGISDFPGIPYWVLRFPSEYMNTLAEAVWEKL